MSYDLVAWPVDRAMQLDEAIREIEGRSSRWKLGLRRDRRINAFAAAMQRAIPGIGTPRSEYPMEFDVHADYVHLALPWSMVAELIEIVAPIAYTAGLALYDPQRIDVAFPAPFGDAPLGSRGVEQHEAMAARALSTIISSFGNGFDPDMSANAALWAQGFHMQSPLGFEITQDLEAEVMANPTRVPTALQTPSHKAELLVELRGTDADARDRARRMLSGWDPDPEIRAVFLAELESDDVFAVSTAATAIAREGNVADLPLLEEAVRRMSPSDGGTSESMGMPMAAAFDLARRAGPEATDDLKRKVRAWRRAPSGARRTSASMSDDDFEQLLAILAEGPPAAF